MSQQNVDLVRSAYDAYNRRDVEGVLGAFDPMIDWNVPDSLAWGGHAAGIDAVARFFQGSGPTSATATRSPSTSSSTPAIVSWRSCATGASRRTARATTCRRS